VETNDIRRLPTAKLRTIRDSLDDDDDSYSSRDSSSRRGREKYCRAQIDKYSDDSSENTRRSEMKR
jgi:hypothetical protein